MAASENDLQIELYKMAAQTRNMEIALFWQRSNYFLVLSTAIAAGFFSLDNRSFALVLSILGFCVSVLWVAVNLGSKFWSCRWEYRLRKAENDVRPGIDLFSANWETVQGDVLASFGTRNRGRLHSLYQKCVMLKPSVTMMMTILSVMFVVFWVVTAILHVALTGINASS